MTSRRVNPGGRMRPRFAERPVVRLPMRIFFECVAQAVMENGIRGLAQMVPGGAYACDVAEGAWKKYREKMQEQQLRDDIAQLAQVSLEDAKREAVAAIREVIGSGASPTDDEMIDLELYLSAIPDAVRQSLKRPEDPAGKSAPSNFSLRDPDEGVTRHPQSSNGW